MSEINELRHGSANLDADVGVHQDRSDTKDRAERLRHAIRAAGGNTSVATRSGVPKSTIDGYLQGGELKLSNAIALAQATGVRLEWLATGEGPMRAPASPAPDDPRTAEDVQALIAQGHTDHPFFSTIPGQLALRMAKPSAPPARLFGQVKIDRLVQAYDGALASTRGADKRLTMHLTVVLYDQLTEAAESQGNRASPADAPATAGATTAGVEP